MPSESGEKCYGKPPVYFKPVVGCNKMSFKKVWNFDQCEHIRMYLHNLLDWGRVWGYCGELQANI